jgi:voltage-gated potassium channel
LNEVNARVKKWEERFEKYIVALSLIFVVVLIIPIVHSISGAWRSHLDRIDIGIWAIFVIDYIGKFTIADNKRAFIKSHVFELLIIILPFLRPLRILRVIPLVGYFLKYSRKTLSGQLLQYILMAAVLITAPAALLMLDVEKYAKGANIKTLGDVLWWAITTLTTVGYGDRYPVTPSGRLIAVLVMLLGVAMVGAITASIASWLVKADEDASDKVQMKELLDRLESIERKLDDKN